MDKSVFDGIFAPERRTEPGTYIISSTKPSKSVYIGNFRQEGGVGPDTFAQLNWHPGKGFELTMWSYNTNPLARFTHPNDPVCKDSCMECFLDVFPAHKYTKGYINIEMNALGTCLCAFGPSRHDRTFLTELGVPHPEVTIEHVTRDGGECWLARTFISKDVLELLYKMPCDLRHGHQMRANFYTCAEDVAEPYWGSWSPVEKLDFHTPEYFGLLEID